MLGFCACHTGQQDQTAEGASPPVTQQGQVLGGEHLRPATWAHTRPLRASSDENRFCGESSDEERADRERPTHAHPQEAVLLGCLVSL